MTTISEPVGGATVWKAADIDSRQDWRYRLSAAELDDIHSALDYAKRTGKPTTEMTREDFPLGILAPVIAGWMETLQVGAGFVNVSGLPTHRFDDDDLALIHWGLGTHIGTGVSQNAAGDLLSHIRDVGANPADRGTRLYKTSVELGFHSDGSDIVGLMCIRPSKFGGSNRLASCGAIYNEIIRRRPDLLPLLYEPFYWDRNNEQSEGEDPFFVLPICMRGEGYFRFFYIGWYIRNAQRHPEVPRLSAEQVQLLDLIDAIAADPEFHVEFRMEPGEINYLKNSAALHMRTAFEDFDQLQRKRHLIRLWLTAHGEWQDADAFVQQGIPVKEGVQPDSDVIAAGDGT
jgi:hypothetical protein